MKKLNIIAIVPVLSLLMAACSSPVALQTAEYDDMYYTSSDKTEFVQTWEQESQDEQYYADGAAAGTGTDNYEGDEYYDGRAYNPRDNWYRPNYSFVDPYWGAAYNTGFYPRSSFRYGSAFYDPFYDPFFDPFYSPFYSPWGPSFNRFSISMGFGMGMGMGGFGHPFYGGMWGNPYRGYYNGFNNGFYQGFYTGSYLDRVGAVRQVQYGPRDERSTTGTVRSGRPAREDLTSTGQQRMMTTPGAHNARPSRPMRGGSGVVGGDATQTQQSTAAPSGRPAMPARPSRGGSYQQQPAGVNQQQVQSAPERQQQPVRESRPARQVQPRQQSMPNYERSTPSYERSSPSQSYPSQSSPSSSPSYNRGGGGGRPSRGGF